MQYHQQKNNNTRDPLTCDVPLMYIMYMLTSARETGSCQVSSFCTTQIILADVLSVIPVQTCVLGAQKNRHRNGETVLLSTQDKCLLLRNQVICHLRILIWRSGYFFRVLSPRKYCNEDSGPSKLIVLNSEIFL